MSKFNKDQVKRCSDETAEAICYLLKNDEYAMNLFLDMVAGCSLKGRTSKHKRLPGEPRSRACVTRASLPGYSKCDNQNASTYSRNYRRKKAKRLEKEKEFSNAT